MSFASSAAASRRESARRNDGKFGHQMHAESTVQLGALNVSVDRYERGYDADLQEQGSPMTYGDQPSVLAPAQKAALDQDIQDIMANDGYSNAEKLRFQDMATQLDRTGAGVFSGVSTIDRDLKFGKGSAYGGNPVPPEFSRFRQGANAPVRPVPTPGPAAAPAAVPASEEVDFNPKGSADGGRTVKGFRRLFGRS